MSSTNFVRREALIVAQTSCLRQAGGLRYIISKTQLYFFAACSISGPDFIKSSGLMIA